MGGLAIAYIRLLVLDPSSDKTIRSLTPLRLKYLMTVVSSATSVTFLGYEISQALTVADLWEQPALVVDCTIVCHCAPPCTRG